jgi:two-component system alkaline phosphatase synthesis response regulator PhoP
MEVKLLIVEDHEHLRLTLQDYFEREGFDVIVAKDGDQALSVLDKVRPDLIILDVGLPHTDGLEVCRAARHRFGHSVGIVMISGAKKEDVDKIIGLEVGADVYITKPVENTVLRSQVRALVRRIQAQSAPGDPAGWFVIDDLRVHFEGRRVQAGSREITLAPLEFDLLTYLIQNAGKACSREDAKDAVWGPGTDVSDEALNTLVAKLRRKIEPDPANPRYIKKVQGVGYRFDI